MITSTKWDTCRVDAIKVKIIKQPSVEFTCEKNGETLKDVTIINHPIKYKALWLSGYINGGVSWRNSVAEECVTLFGPKHDRKHQNWLNSLCEIQALNSGIFF